MPEQEKPMQKTFPLPSWLGWLIFAWIILAELVFYFLNVSRYLEKFINKMF